MTTRGGTPAPQEDIIMIYFYWITGLGLALTLSVLIAVTADHREDADRASV